MSINSSKEANLVVAPQILELPELLAKATEGNALLTPASVLFDSVEIILSVVIGQSKTTLGQLLRMKETDVLTIDREVDRPVDIVVNGKVVARGQLLVVEDCFGVRVTEVAAMSQG